MDGRIASLVRRLGRHDHRSASGAPAPEDNRSARQRSRRRSKGQVLVLFALGIFVLTGAVAMVIDVTWYWANTLKVQRAADAAALAGVIYLPGNVTLSVSTARAEAVKNGYSNGSSAATCRNSSLNNVVVTPTQDGSNPRRMDVTVSAPVSTFFMRIFGIDCIQATRKAKAEFVLPVPMGSPENYYGIDQLARSTGFATLAVPNASGAGTLAAKGFWGAVLTKGSDKANGDAFNPVTDITGGGVANPNYDPAGYGYTVEIPQGSAGGRVHVYDATYCPTGKNAQTGAGGYLGTGDHWMSGTDQTNPTAVSTYFNLWDTNDTPYDTSDDMLLYSSGSLFENKLQVDRSAQYAPIADSSGKLWAWGDGWQYDTNAANRKPTAAVAPDCATDPYHNGWWTLPPNLGPGTYRLQVTTTSSSNAGINASTRAENMFGLEVTASGSTTPRIYGSGRMCAYNNLANGAQRFYLAQIEGIHAGKTMEINLFDPGDVGGDAWLRVMSPYGGTYQRATFSYTATNGKSGTNVTQIQTAVGGANQFNDTWITIQVALPANYGTSNITPAGEPGPGWWKVEYQVGGGNDTTTWMVGIRGNPVHLIVP